MAKKQELKSDEFDFDDLDMPDLDFNGPDIKDDRNPATKIAMSTLEGFKDTALSSDNVRQLVRKSLPRGYGATLDLADHTADTLKNLYNTTAREVKPLVNELKRTSARMVPLADKVLPKRLSAGFKRWTENIDGRSGSLSPEEMREQGLQAELGEIFKIQAEQTHKRNTESDARQRIQDGIAFNRHGDLIGQLDPIRKSTGLMAQLQSKIGVNYQRKSLELQYRSYFLAMDMAQETKKHNATTITQMEGILKNTGLPEFVKLKNSERLAEIIRNRFINGIGDSLADKRRNFVKNLGTRITQRVQEKVKASVDATRMGLGAVDSLADLQEMQAQFGQRQSAGQMAGNMAGSMAASSLTDKLGDWIYKRLNQNEKVARTSNNLMYNVQNLPQLALEWANSTRGIGKNNWGQHSEIIGGLKEAIQMVMRQESADMEGDKLSDIRNPDMFSRRTNRSITDIIPGFLARIYRELKIMRTGDANQELVEYDYTANKFNERSTVTKNVLKTLVGEGDKSSLQRSFDDLFGELDKDGTKLTPEQRNKLSRLMLKNNLQNKVGDSKLYSDASSDVYREMSVDDAEASAKMFQEYFKGDNLDLRRQVFSREFNTLGMNLSDKRATMQDFMNTGQREHLEALGLLAPGSNTIDMEKLQGYLLGDQYTPPPNTPSSGPANPLGGPPQPPQPNGPGNKAAKKIAQLLQQLLGNGGQPPTPAPVPQPAPAGPAASPFPLAEVVKAIEDNSSKPETRSAAEILMRIEARLEQGITWHQGDPNGPGGGGPGGPRGPWWNRGLLDLTRSAAGGARRGAGWLWNKGNESRRKLQGWVGKGAGMVGKAGSWLKQKALDFNDIYIEGETKPRLLAWRLKAGQYYDQASGQVIKSMRDIRGAVVDANGNIVLTVEDAQKAFERSKVGKGLASIWGGIKKMNNAAWDTAKKLAPGIYGFGIDMLQKTYNKVGKMLDAPQDIYIAGKADPVMLAVTMKAGGYISRIKGTPILHPSEIDGPVLDEQGNVVLTAEQLAGGLLDKNGRPLAIGYKGLFQRAKNTIMGAIDRVTGGLSKARDWIMEKGGAVLKGGLSLDFSIGGGKRARGQSLLLLQIRDMLNARLPGEPTVFAEDVELPTADGGMKKAKNAIRNGAQKLKDKWAALKNKIFGDRDGDGDRDGSYQDWLQKQKEKVAEAKQKAAEKLAKLKGAGKDKMDSLLALLKRKEQDEDDEDDDGGIDIDLGDGDDGDKDKKRRRKKARRLRRMRRNRAPRGLWGKTKNLAGRAGRGLWGGAKMLGRGALNVGRGALGMGGGAIGRIGMLARVGGMLGLSGVSGLASAAAGAGGALLSGAGALGGTLLTGAGTVLGGLGAILASPVVLGALAVAAVGTAGYFAYKHFSKKKLETFSKLRYAQYGFLPTDEDHLQQVMGLEDKLKNAVVIEPNGTARLDDKKVDLKDLLSSMGLEDTRPQAVEGFAQWFALRFKPVFLNSMAALRAVAPDKFLDDVEKLSPTQKRQYLNIAKFPGGPYHVSISPFAEQKTLAAGQREVDAAVQMAEAELAKELAKAGAATPEAAKVAGTAGALAAATAGSTNVQDAKAVTTPATPAKLDPGKVNQLAQAATVGAAVAGTALRGEMTAVGPDALAELFNSDRLDAMTALRFRTYGLKELMADKVRALMVLEIHTLKKVSYIKGGTAVWSGSAEEMVMAMGPGFGVEGVANTLAYDWISWFTMRFLPTYLAYLTAMAVATGKNTLKEAQMALRAIQAVDVAMMTYTAKGVYNGNQVSVWQIPTSPWAGYELNGDVTTTEGNVQSLKDKAKSTTVTEETGKRPTEGSTNAAAAVATANRPEAQNRTTGFFARLFGTSDNPGTASNGAPASNGGGFFSGIANSVSNVYEGAKSALGFEGGVETSHPGKGTGGDINQIPLPKGNGSWDALKDTITAAARMVGVDEKLMATMAALESGFNYKVKAKTSSATGLYQFITDTWASMLKTYGGKYGIAPNTSPTDPRANALMGAEFLKYNLGELRKSVKNRPITDTDVYISHFFGAGGARKFLNADPNALGANVLPEAASKNIPVFYRDGRPLTVGEIYASINARLRKKGEKFGLGGGGEAIIPTAAKPAASTAPAAPGGSAPTAAPTVKPAAIPVNDQTPVPMGAAGPAAQDQAAKKAAAAPAKAPATPSATPSAPPTSAAPVGTDLANMNSYMSPRSRDLAAQTQYQRDEAAKVLGETNGILQKSHETQIGILDTAKQILAHLRGQPSKDASSSVLQQPVKPVTPAQAPKPAPRSMTPAPVSMSRL